MNGAANWDLLLVLGSFTAVMCALGWYVHNHRAPEPQPQDRGASTRYTVQRGSDKDGRYWATVPALPGVIVHGQSEEEVKARISALALRALADRLESHQVKPHTFCFDVGA
jgi:predicted RNase H-like HicB family nuclease